MVKKIVLNACGVKSLGGLKLFLESFDFFETIADDGRLWLKIRLLSDNNPLR